MAGQWNESQITTLLARHRSVPPPGAPVTLRPRSCSPATIGRHRQFQSPRLNAIFRLRGLASGQGKATRRPGVALLCAVSLSGYCIPFSTSRLIFSAGTREPQWGHDFAQSVAAGHGFTALFTPLSVAAIERPRYYGSCIAVSILIPTGVAIATFYDRPWLLVGWWWLIVGQRRIQFVLRLDFRDSFAFGQHAGITSVGCSGDAIRLFYRCIISRHFGCFLLPSQSLACVLLRQDGLLPL